VGSSSPQLLKILFTDFTSFAIPNLKTVFVYIVLVCGDKSFNTSINFNFILRIYTMYSSY
jgi:hypothetical protein